MSGNAANRMPMALSRHGDLAAMKARALKAPQPVATGRTRIRLWLPLTPLFWLLAPFAILLSPLLTLAPPLRGLNPFAAAIAIGHVLTSLGGTEVDVNTHDARIRIRIL